MKDIDLKNVPKHIGIIMDGNGRWAKNRFLPRIAGHKEGMNRVVDIVEECCKIGVRTLTLYAFSTENWKRPEEEVNGLMNILVIYINSQLKRILENNIVFRVIGDYSKLPDSIVKLLETIEVASLMPARPFPCANTEAVAATISAAERIVLLLFKAFLMFLFINCSCFSAVKRVDGPLSGS